MPVTVSLSEALTTPEPKQASTASLTGLSPKKLSLDLEPMLEHSLPRSSLEPRKVELPASSLCRSELPGALLEVSPLSCHSGPPMSPPPALPPSLPADALSNSFTSPPPSLPASMPLAPAPAIEAVEVPAPPSQPPAIPADIVLPGGSEEEKTSTGKQPKLSLPVKILRFDPMAEAEKAKEESEDSSTLSAVDEDETPFGQSRTGMCVLFPPGLQPPPNTPSHGSVLHGEGSCRPCAWFWKAGGCKNGAECGHCHLCPEGEIKARKKVKQTIMRLGLATPKVSGTSEDDHCKPQELLAMSMSQKVHDKAGEEKAIEQQEIDELLSAACAPAAEASCSAGGSSDHESSTTGSEHELSDASHGSPRSCTTPLVHFPPGLEQHVKFESELRVLSSQGSKAHGTGACRPCAWFWKPSGCQSGQDCKYCHDCPQGELKSRKKSKHAIMRLGLATPKAENETVQKTKFALSLESLLQC